MRRAGREKKPRSQCKLGGPLVVKVSRDEIIPDGEIDDFYLRNYMQSNTLFCIVKSKIPQYFSEEYYG